MNNLKYLNMKALILFSIMLVSIIGSGQNNLSLYDFKVTDIQGNEFQLSQLMGKKVLIVNTASKCGFTPQYDDLEKLYNTYKDKNFVIIGFPANNFLKQEPGTNEEIQEFCRKNYGVTFPMMSKISVKGNDIHPLYKWLTTETNSDVSWNFQKYMIDENGKIVGYVSPKTKPFDEKIVNWILK
jgi:glutathione peroxidase